MYIYMPKYSLFCMYKQVMCSSLEKTIFLPLSGLLRGLQFSCRVEVSWAFPCCPSFFKVLLCYVMFCVDKESYIAGDELALALY